MAARAFITGLAGPDAHGRRARVSARGRAVGPHPVQAQYRDAGAGACARRGVPRGGRRADAPVLIDQEGGRVQRLGPPHWPAYPPGARLRPRSTTAIRGAGLAAARLGARLIAADLRDARHRRRLPAARRRAGARRRRGDRRPRLRRRRPTRSRRSPRAVAEGLMDGGVLPVLKHMPGHGRANADSHRSAAGGRRRPRDAGSDRFRGVPAAREACRWG